VSLCTAWTVLARSQHHAPVHGLPQIKRLDSLGDFLVRAICACGAVRENTGSLADGVNSLDAVLVGYYEGDALQFADKVRAGLVPFLRREVEFIVTPAADCTYLPPAHEPRRAR
jgi:hypothetical protein